MAKGVKTGGRTKGTPNKNTVLIEEVLGDYCPLSELIKIVQKEDTPRDVKVKINITLLGYIYPKRSTIDMDIIRTNINTKTDDVE